MLVNFTKMHGLGNDFVVIDLITQSLKLHAAHIKKIADRHFGIGCDQLLLVEPPIRKDADFYLRIYNANGHEVENCGNGARCAAKFFYDSGFSNKTELMADCLAGELEFKILDENEVTVNMGPPNFRHQDIPFKLKGTQGHNYANIESKDKDRDRDRDKEKDKHQDQEFKLHPLDIEGQMHEMAVLSMGNPHAVLKVPNVDSAPVKKLGPLITKNGHFPKETNVEFMQVVDKNQIRLKVFERGVGETFSCGSGACAAVVAGIRLKWLESPVTVSFETGSLVIHWEGGKKPVYLTGPTLSVFVGKFRL